MVQVIGTRRIFQGRIIGVRVDDVIYPNGNRAEVEIVEHNGGVCIAAQPDPASIVLVRQYRPAIGRELWEVPAGKLDGDEAPAAAARRELIEETGYRCSTLEQVRTFYSAPGFCGELLYLFSAGGLTAGAPQPEADEVLHVKTFALAEVQRMIECDEIPDAKTQIAVAWALRTRPGA